MRLQSKVCPICAVSHPAEAVRCGCGYSFDPTTLSSDVHDLECIYHEERLYRDDLAVRVDEARRAVQLLQVAARHELSEAARALSVRLAAALAELEAQEQRLRVVKNHIDLSRSNGRVKRAGVLAIVSTKPKSSPAAVPDRSNQPTARARLSGEQTVSNKPAPSFRASQLGSAARPAVSNATVQECARCSGKAPFGAGRCGCGLEMLQDSNDLPWSSLNREERAAVLAALSRVRK